jgi:hypothetical protein
MKALLYGLALCVLAAGSAVAQTVQWQGVFQVTAERGDCPWDNTGWTSPVRFMPPVTPENPPEASFTVFLRQYAQAFIAPGNFTNSFQKVEQPYIGATFGREKNVWVRFDSVKPAEITVDTPFVQIVGKIKGFDDRPADCVSTFRMIAAKRS